jgi:D-galactarolactone cycloisomerase
VREAAGPAVDLLIDANMAWDRSQAAAMIEQLAAYDPYWIEEPLPANDVAGLAALLTTSRVRIAAGENAFGCDDVRTLLTERAVSVLMPDPTRAGGITEVRRMCALAAAWGIPYSPHHYGSDVGFAAALHLMAATPGGTLMLRDVSPAPLREMILAEPLAVHDGYARVPDGPGLGIRLDMDVVQAYSVDTR